MGNFVKTFNVTSPTLPFADTVDISALKADNSAGAFQAGDPPAVGPSSDSTVVTIDSVNADASKMFATCKKAGTATIPIVCDGITLTLTYRINPTFAKIDANSENSPGVVSESDLTPA